MSYFKPRDNQNKLIRFGQDHLRCNWFAGMGTGKTGAALTLSLDLDTFGEIEEHEQILIFAPKRVAETTWPDEVAAWPESFGRFSIAACVGPLEQRLAALRAKPKILTCSYDHAPWLIEQYGDDWNFPVVFADESPLLKGLRVSIQRVHLGNGEYSKEFIRGQGGTRAKALAQVAHKRVRRWVNMTGSPVANGYLDLWGQQWFIDAGAALGNSFSDFAWRWFRQKRNSDRKHQSFELMPGSSREIRAKLRPSSISIRAEDYFDVDKPMEKIIYVDLPPKARKNYNEMQRELFTWVDEHPVEVFAAGPKMNKCLQMANGSVYVDGDGNWANVHDEKIEALKSIVVEAMGAPLLVVYVFKPDKAKILKAFPFAQTLEKNANKVAQDFRDGKIPMLVIHAKSAGHGLNLQHNCWMMVDYGSFYNLEWDEQVIERIGPMRQLQIGKKRVVFRFRIVARDTIEQSIIMPLLKAKGSLQELFKIAMKQHL